MELTDIKPIDREVELLHPRTKDGLGLFFQLRSPYSPEVKKIEREWLDLRLQRNKGEDIGMDAVNDLRERQILAGVCDWRFDGPEALKINGEQPAFTVTRLKKLIRTEGLEWIREFLDKETGDRAAFFEKSEKA